jgi:hypothetical protein
MNDVVFNDKIEDRVTPNQITEEYKEAVDIFPALHKYKKEHNIVNLQKLCVEIAEFCLQIYASTQSDEERKVYKSMLEKLNK